ncbi:hypothetical protein Pd630_LPD04454 [Rhodococcus opacus PD630]|nr:hypothetical protein Pd630_LPD04454 [Rhodococcus opacus PD630]
MDGEFEDYAIAHPAGVQKPVRFRCFGGGQHRPDPHGQDALID